MSVKILRGIIQIKETDVVKSLLENLKALTDSDFEFQREEEKQIFSIVRDFAIEHGSVPHVDFVGEELKRFYIDEAGELDVVKLLKEQTLFVGPNFQGILQQEKTWQRKRELERSLKKGLSDLAGMAGKRNDNEVIDGVCNTVAKSIYNALTGKEEVQTHGVITESALTFIERQRKKREKLGSVGKMLGYEVTDLSFRGVKPGELVMIAGYVAECKTLLCKNIALNMVTMFNYNVLYVSLEMKFEQMEDSFYTMCTADPKWNRAPLIYSDVRDGFIDDADMIFLDQVAHDLNDRSRNGRLVVHQPKKRFTLEDISILAETENAIAPLDCVIIDYLQLLDEPDKQELLKKAKSFALTFARGKGIPVISPWQINREGKSEFDEWLEKGKRRKYRLTSLSETSEAERSADKVLAVAFDEQLKTAGQLEVQDLKARDDDQFKTHYLQVNSKCGRITNSASSVGGIAAGQVQQEQDDKFKEVLAQLSLS